MWISFDPKVFEATVRSSLNNILPRHIFEEHVNMLLNYVIPGKTYKWTHCSR